MLKGRPIRAATAAKRQARPYRRQNRAECMILTQNAIKIKETFISE